MPKRPCLDCGVPTPGTRCPTHRRTREQARGTRQQRGYDAEYQRARAALHLEQQPPCAWCGRPATTADHWPPLQVAGRRHTNLVPACHPCNSGRVALRRWTEQHEQPTRPD